MGSGPRKSRRLGATWALGALLLAVQLLTEPARARPRPDAGAPRQSHGVDRPQRELPPQHSAFFPKTIPSALLSERVQATMAARARAAQPAPSADTAEAPPPLSPPPAPPAAPGPSEAAARPDEARMRRVQSIETEDGVTILSNRLLDAPNAPRVVASEVPVVRSRPSGETVIDKPQITKTHSLRTAKPTPATGDEHNESDTWPSWLILSSLGVAAAGMTGGGLWLQRKRWRA